jgi:hypothetical protein
LTQGTGGSIVSDELVLTEQAQAANAAYSTDVSWFQQKDSSSISLLAQFRTGGIYGPDGFIQAAEIDIILISDGNNTIRLYAADHTDFYDTKMSIFLEWTKSGSSAETIQVDDLDVFEGSERIWYDICGTFDNTTNIFSLYVCKSCDSASSWSYTNDYLYGTSTLTATPDNSLTQEISPTNYPEDVTWSKVYLLNGNVANIYVDNDEKAELKYAMVVDDFIPPIEYNWFRRLFHYWNKSSGDWPK